MKKGCVIVALGTPKSLELTDISDFLRAFLSDPQVVDFPRWLWKPILEKIILRNRPAKIAHNYASIWLPAGSPLEVYTKTQAALLQEKLPEVAVTYAVTYLEPAIRDEICKLSQQGITDITVIPLYPQYTPSTVGDIYRQIAQVRADFPQLMVRIAQSWETLAEYVDFYVEQLQQVLEVNSIEHLVFSYHGVPLRKAHQPVAYRAQCEATTNAIWQALLASNPKAQYADKLSYETTFQSKFGPGKWLAPATIKRMKELPAGGKTRIAVLTPGFVSDCIETLEEIDIQNRQVFFAHGGKEFVFINPLNDAPVSGEVLAQVYAATQENWD